MSENYTKILFLVGFYVVEWCKSLGFKSPEKSFTEMRVVFKSMYSDMLRNSIERGTDKELFYLFMDFEILKVAHKSPLHFKG